MSNHFNKLTPAEAERIALLMEECGEVIQICGKILRHGYESSHPESPLVSNKNLLHHELGDVMAAIKIMNIGGDISFSELQDCEACKLKSVGRYLHHQDEIDLTKE